MLKTVGFTSTRTGDQTIVNGNLVIGTAGKGIDFSADPNPGGMTSELLDDYEEGTWTPIIVASGGGTAGYNTPNAFYTKIGRQVTVVFDFQLNSLNTLSGDLSIGGLPFTRNVGDILGATNLAIFINITTSIINMPVFPQSGTTEARLYMVTAATTNSATSRLTPADCTNNLRLAGTITYNT